jgi:uncharacterized protein YegL
MKKDFTMVIVLLDKSGSMLKVHEDTIGGFNMFLEEQKIVPGEVSVSLIQFNNKTENTYIDVPINHIAPLTKESYKPSGWTALNDSLAKTIGEVGKKLSAKPEHERPSNVVILIMTDGEENASRDFAGHDGLSKVKEMIKHQQDKYSWKFVFIGSNIDSFTTSSMYGIPSTYTINYTQSPSGQFNAFKSLSRGMVANRMKGGTAVNFFENENDITNVSHVSLDTSDIQSTINKYVNNDQNKNEVK